MLDPIIAPHMHSKFIDASNVQICSACVEHLSFERPSIFHPWLFEFGSAETAQKDALCADVRH